MRWRLCGEAFVDDVVAMLDEMVRLLIFRFVYINPSNAFNTLSDAFVIDVDYFLFADILKRV